jgi:Flp pilus assembly protein TadG
MQRLRDDSGQVIVLTVLSATAILGVVAFATDVGLLLRAKRVMQTAADSAALAGAAEIKFGDVQSAADADAAQNGIPTSAVTVNTGPTSGPHQGNTAYIEVIVSQSEPTFFMKVFNLTSMTVSARAVATNVPSPSCVDTLQSNPTTPTGKKGALVSVPGVAVTNGASLTLSSCGVIDDASGSGALTVSGAGVITAKAIGVVGTESLSGSGTTTPAAVTGIAPITDPLSSVATAPPASEYTSGCLTDPSITKSTTIGPASPTGYVCYNGLTFPKGSPTVTLNPGLYIINGQGSANAYSLNVASGTTLNGTGVTFYFVNDASFNITNGATLNLTAPTSGSYSGLLFYQDSGDSAMDTFAGGSSGNLAGIFYLPAANLTFENGNSSTFSTDLVVGSLDMSGAATLTPYAPLSGASPLSSPRIVE